MEMRAANGEASIFDKYALQTLYFGGGTPTVYPVAVIKKLADRAIELFFDASPQEWTVEANPDDLTDDYLRQLVASGVTRLSIGIQSFIDRDLRLMRRRHSAAAAIEAVKKAQQAGFGNINIDLIYGFPGMSANDWRYNLDMAVSLDIQHISAYHLSIEEKTIFGKMAAKKLVDPVDENASDMQYRMLEERLEKAGFIHYEISNFALPDFHSRHNSAYWEQLPYIGVGPSAHGYDGKLTRRSNVANNIAYIESINKNIIPETVEILTERDIYNECLLTALRTRKGLHPNKIPENYRDIFIKKIKKHLASGCVIYDDTYKIPTNYLLISDSIISDLIEA
jgi:oxygen-independent coproporphyrinogen-3 oxidase